MEQIDFPFSRNLPLKRLVADALVEIERLGYSGKSRRRYRATWEHLVAFADRMQLGDEFSGTQQYLHLTAELFPEITARLDATFGPVIPRRIEP